MIRGGWKDYLFIIFKFKGGKKLVCIKTQRQEQAPFQRLHGEQRWHGTWLTVGWCALAPGDRGPGRADLWWCHRGPPARTCSGHCDDFRAEDKEAWGGRLGVGFKGKWHHFQQAVKKVVGSDRMPSPCQCMLSKPGALLGGRVHLLFLFLHLLNPDTVVSRADSRHVPPWSRKPNGKERY